MQFKSTPTCQPAACNDLGFLVQTHLSFWWNQSLINPVRSACQESALPTVGNSNGVNVNGVSEKSCSPRDTDSLVSDGANAKARNNASCSCWSAYQYKTKFIETSAKAMFATNRTYADSQGTCCDALSDQMRNCLQNYYCRKRCSETKTHIWIQTFHPLLGTHMTLCQHSFNKTSQAACSGPSASYGPNPQESDQEQ